jgi:hypothetical protein
MKPMSAGHPSFGRSCRVLLCALAPFTLAACADEGTDAETVARVEGHRLTVEEVVELTVDNENLPVSADVVEAIAGLWIDYTLLARVAATDSTLEAIDFTPLVRARLDQEALGALGDSAIQADTVVTEADARAWHETSGEGVRFRASHIMLQYPPQATQAQRDSVRERLAGIRDDILAGASFEATAREVSQDPGSAPQGGDLGYFSPGDLVRPFEEAVEALEPGEMSDIVATPMGLHVIRLEDRERPDFAEVSSEVVARLRMERLQQAESLYVSGVEERAGALTVVDGAVEVARDLARNPSVSLSGRAARRPLVEWGSGSLEAARYLQLLRLEPPVFHEQVAGGSVEALEDFLEALARRELILAEAEQMGLTASPERVDSLASEAASQIREAARRLDLIPLDRAPGEDLERAVQRAVLGALEDNLAGANPSILLGPLTYQLRSGHAHSISNAGVGRAVLELGRQRAARGASPMDSVMPLDTTPPGGGS